MLKNFRVDRLTFRIFFLKNEENQRVVVEEVSEIDFEKVKNHLEKGESVFIAPKRQGELRTSQVEKDDFGKHWYFTHI